jgi:hypothetical protein
MSEDVTSAYGSENTSRGHADVSESGNESQNVTDFPEAAARRAAVMVGRLVSSMAAGGAPERPNSVWSARPDGVFAAWHKCGFLAFQLIVGHCVWPWRFIATRVLEWATCGLRGRAGRSPAVAPMTLLVNRGFWRRPFPETDDLSPISRYLVSD